MATERSNNENTLEEELLLLPGKARGILGDAGAVEHVASSVVLAVACGLAVLSRFSSLLVFAFGLACGALLLLAAQVRVGARRAVLELGV